MGKIDLKNMYVKEIKETKYLKEGTETKKYQTTMCRTGDESTKVVVTTDYPVDMNDSDTGVTILVKSEQTKL